MVRIWKIMFRENRFSLFIFLFFYLKSDEKNDSCIKRENNVCGESIFLLEHCKGFFVLQGNFDTGKFIKYYKS